MVKRGRPPGRTSALKEPEKVDRFIEEIRKGNFLKTAAALAGFSDSRVYEWFKVAKEAENKKELTPHEKDCCEFRARFMKADAEALDRHIIFITNDTDWRARQWFLQHRYPDVFTNQPIKIEGDIQTKETIKADPTLIKALGDLLVSVRSGSPPE